MLKGKKILLGVTGSIAAYKAILLVRSWVKEGAEVRVIMTPSARDFVTPLSLSTLSKYPVLSDLFEEDTWANHALLGRWADVMIIAPLSCNTLAKMANGLCDNLLLATYLSATCPVVIAPAMDEDMWHHPATQENLEKLKARGNLVIPVERGELASGLEGEGRMAEPDAIFQFVSDNFFFIKDLSGKKVMVTAGPTQEQIDPVRFISNHSSGKMGVAIAEEMAKRGAVVDLILGPTTMDVDIPRGQIYRVASAGEMYELCMEKFPLADIAVMTAAVADYTPAHVSEKKIKKTSETITLELVKTKDILKSLGQKKTKEQILVGFALENQNEKEYAMSKLESKNADLIILNSLNDEGAGFGLDTNKITIFERGGNETKFDTKPKRQVAKDIVDKIVKLLK